MNHVCATHLKAGRRNGESPIHNRIKREVSMKRITLCTVTSMVASAAMFLSTNPSMANEADDKIEATFVESYVYRTYLKDDKIKADSENGTVTLTGTVARESNKALAQDTLENTPGVVGVVNELATTAEVATEKADAKIAGQVKRALFFHSNVSYSATTVAVADGVVTLTGEATSQAQKELTTEYASDIDGVISVTNQMTVAATVPEAVRTPGEKIDDASVTAQVKAALLAHRSTSALRTQVVTRSGEVTLTGIAKNEAEIALVTKLVNDIHGVTGVKNQMTVGVAE